VVNALVFIKEVALYQVIGQHSEQKTRWVTICERISTLVKSVFYFFAGVGLHKNKKSELMLMRCARAYSTSCSHVIVVYFHSFRRNTLFCR